LNSNERRRRPEEDFASREEAIEQCVSLLMSIAAEMLLIYARRAFLQPPDKASAAAEYENAFFPLLQLRTLGIN
jgi:hypothetical protein